MSRPASAAGSNPAISCSKCWPIFSRLHLVGLFQPVRRPVSALLALNSPLDISAARGYSSNFAVSLPQLPDAELNFAVQGG